MKYFLILLLCIPANFLKSQENIEADAVRAVIEQMFESMRTSDTVTMTSLFDTSARLQTVFLNHQGTSELRLETVADFITAIARPRTAKYDERIWSYDIRLDGNLSTVWTEYSFFVGDKLSHCGVNAFQLYKDKTGKWKIHQITDTRRKTNCFGQQPDFEKEIGTLIDNWHRAAAVADEDAFFGSMTENAIYLGTDATERWLRDEMRVWAKPYFDKESAWSFQSNNRKIYIAENMTIAWFEELLDTWMGVCRGSGVVVRKDSGWKISHYNLAVTVPNDMINGFIDLVKKGP
jgi:hypothetical protein